jgi:hypothetical protein
MNRMTSNISIKIFVTLGKFLTAHRPDIKIDYRKLKTSAIDGSLRLLLILRPTLGTVLSSRGLY